MKQEIRSLESKTKTQKIDLDKAVQENQTLLERIQCLSEENENIKKQNNTLQNTWGELESQVNTKNEQIISLQKLNQHISQSLFEEKQSKKLETKTAPNSDTSFAEDPNQLLSDLHLY